MKRPFILLLFEYLSNKQKKKSIYVILKLDLGF